MVTFLIRLPTMTIFDTLYNSQGPDPLDTHLLVLINKTYFKLLFKLYLLIMHLFEGPLFL